MLDGKRAAILPLLGEGWSGVRMTVDENLVVDRNTFNDAGRQEGCKKKREGLRSNGGCSLLLVQMPASLRAQTEHGETRLNTYRKGAFPFASASIQKLAFHFNKNKIAFLAVFTAIWKHREPVA